MSEESNLNKIDSSHGLEQIPSAIGSAISRVLSQGPSNHPILEDEHHELTDSEGEDDFIRKYGDINYQYIKKPKEHAWFMRPHALNYFKDGILYRSKGERSATTMELFMDLLYVGIIANLAGSASEDASGGALLRYVLLFVPAWTVWVDFKDFVNYYYNGDISQRLSLLCVLCLLVMFSNSHLTILDGPANAAATIVPYMLIRLSLSVTEFAYSFFIPEHRVQMRIYSTLIVITSCLWIPVIFVDTRTKIGLTIMVLFLEQASFIVAYHPWTKRLFKLNVSTALNLEHEVERFSTFVTIAFGEYTYKVVAGLPFGTGFTEKFGRGIFLLITSYCLFWIYNNGSACQSAVHPLRHSAHRACVYIYIHLPLVAGLVLSADAGGEIAGLDFTRLSKPSAEEILKRAEGEEEPNMYALSFFFTGGICVSLLCMFVLGMLDKSRDPVDLHYISKFWRIFFRVPVAIVILCLSFAEMNSTLMMGIITVLVILLSIYETVIMVPKLCVRNRTHNNSQSVMAL